MVSGMIGVPLGALFSTFLREKYPRGDPMICGSGLILSSVFIFATFFYARSNIFMGFAFVFLGEIALNLNWSIVADILLVNTSFLNLPSLASVSLIFIIFKQFYRKRTVDFSRIRTLFVGVEGKTT